MGIKQEQSDLILGIESLIALQRAVLQAGNDQLQLESLNTYVVELDRWLNTSKPKSQHLPAALVSQLESGHCEVLSLAKQLKGETLMDLKQLRTKSRAIRAYAGGISAGASVFRARKG